MNQTELIILLVLALAFLAWAFYAEVRIQKLQGELAVSDRKNKDAEIVKSTGALSDAELDALVSKNLGSAGRKS